MAEASGHSTDRKRKATVAKSPIEQLSSADLCGCAECWKTAVCRSFGRRSARLAAKKHKLGHERQCSMDSAVYDAGDEELEVLVPSADGRYLYVSTNANDFLLVDTLRNEQKLLKPRTTWSPGRFVVDLVAVNSTTILATTSIYAGSSEEAETPAFFRCNLREKKWESVALDPEDIDYVFPIVNPADEQEDGVLVVRSKEKRWLGDRFLPLERFKVERHVFRQPDSLLRQAFVAVRKLHEGVHVEEVIRELVEAAGTSSAVLQTKFFPSAYDGMTPIPARRLY
ncbi:hypothetical protein M3Y99_01070500 [Aphelenchoides fujianensis]|nr:hypothetical protein M3Y99_01070500 [Aphelenchoides fujianensis]